MTWFKWVTPKKLSYFYKSKLLNFLHCTYAELQRPRQKAPFFRKAEMHSLPQIPNGIGWSWRMVTVGFVVFCEPALCGSGCAEE